ncbi:MAG: hypothetical protein MJK12_09865 [Colwellia sp.]|nr:hypothetical protein [Colwellia sp.]
MKEQWMQYSQKYSVLTLREQLLILITGIVVLVMVVFTYFVEDNLTSIKKQNKEVVQLSSANKSTTSSIKMLKQALLKDPNIAIEQQILQYENKLVHIDADLLKLTSDLIDPIQMRHALIELLNLQKGVKLISFEVMPVEPLLLNDKLNNNLPGDEVKTAVTHKNSTNEVISHYAEQPDSLGLYRHSIKLKLEGRYFLLRDYLLQLESLSWTFFWQKFQYQLLEYPISELEVEIYSLSTNKEFIGV